jgi:amidase
MEAAEYATYDGLGLAALMANGDVTPAEVAEAALAAIERANPRIGAVIEVYPSAANADRLHSGPLHGVPFLTKDIGPHFAGLRVEFGSRLAQGYTGALDDAYGALVRSSGVNLIGRTNTPEFSMALCADNLLYGPTSNPWREGYSTSGSSGGAAAAVAAGLVPIAAGSDMGGSIRGPAAWCGTVGLQPSRGRVPAGPDAAESGHGMAQSFGLSRTVRDTAVLLDCLAVPQPGDPFVIPRPDRPYLAYAESPPPRLRIGWSAEPLMDAPVDREVAAAVERVAGLLADLGHDVAQAAPAIDLPAIDRACLQVWYCGFDLRIDELAAATGRAVGPHTLERVTLQAYEFARCQEPRAFFAAQSELNRIRRQIGPFFTRFDLWLSPSCAQVAEPNGVYGMNVDVPLEEFIAREERGCQFLVPYNVTGQPAISLPLAQHSEGLPIGIQLGARPAEEHLLIGVAAELEQALPWRDRVPPLHV